MRWDIIEEKIEIPAGVRVDVEPSRIVVHGPKGMVERRVVGRKVIVEVVGATLKLHADKATRRDKTVIGSLKAHLKNMIIGVQEGYTYKLKICSSHFPMTVAVKGEELSVKNLLGEKIPRTLKLKKGADVKIEGDIIVVTGPDKERTGQTAASIEQLTRRANYDRRIFQDGIYIIEKAGQELR